VFISSSRVQSAIEGIQEKHKINLAMMDFNEAVSDIIEIGKFFVRYEEDK
jgi:hypothetical protein